MKKNKAPSSSSWSLPGLYNLIPKCMYVVCKWLIVFLKKKKSFLSRCPASCSLIGCRSSSLMYYSVRTHSHSRIVNRRQIQIFIMPNISTVLATYWRFPQIVSLIVYTVQFSLVWTSTDLPQMSDIFRWFIKTCQWVKHWAKIVQCELGINDTL